ncbi:MAG: hypothetical protein JXA77_16700 [Bacteroidales bacterium]|nr:hypothetical protein [Bacteroidales bacterium]MBN2819340.1 hypothetical protein [Bacteroidales bacterium]
MPKAIIFIRKLITLTVILLVFYWLDLRITIPYLISIPVFNLVFSLISARIGGQSPKELFNFQRSEKYFTQGGLLDLIRIPVVLLSFIHDLVVWEIWGIYQLFDMLVDIVYFIKQLIYWIFTAVIWFLKLLVPFWRMVYKLFVFYCIKWPWWIYRYAYKDVKRAFRWNVYRIALPGAFIALIILQFFYFLDAGFEISGLRYIGWVLAVLPVSWVFGEIASIRGQKLMKAPFLDVKLQFRNGLETVRVILFFITLFVVIILAEVGLNLLGWIEKGGIHLIGFTLNISYLINIVAIFLVLLIFFGTLIVPSYRLFNEFSETSLQHVIQILKYIFKRILQYIFGFLPSGLFGAITLVPFVIVIMLAVNLTFTIRDNVIDVKIEKIRHEQVNSKEQLTDIKLGKRIETLRYIKQLPQVIVQEIKHRNLVENEFTKYDRDKKELEEDLLLTRNQVNEQIIGLKTQIEQEKQKSVINQTRLEELDKAKQLLEAQLKKYEASKETEIQRAQINFEYTRKKHKQMPLVYYLSSLFIIVVLTFGFTALLGYLGNFFYSAFIFRNDGTPAEWKSFVNEEKEIDTRQPFLSTSLNIIILLCIAVYLIQTFTEHVIF